MTIGGAGTSIVQCRHSLHCAGEAHLGKSGNKVYVWCVGVNGGGNGMHYITRDDGGPLYGTWEASSDDRLKINEQFLPTNITDILMKLRPLKYKKYLYINNLTKGVDDESGNLVPYNVTHFMNDVSLNYTKEEFGLIAQEVYTIPELRNLVYIPMDSDISAIANTTIYDGSLNEPDGYYEAQGWGVKEPAKLHYFEFIPLLIKGFQEHQAVITQQQAVINNLTTENNDLKNKIANIEEILTRNNIN